MNVSKMIGGTALLTLLLVTGCSTQQASPSQAASKSDKEQKDDDHSHGTGPHGGTVADWGGGKWHIEFKVDHGKQEATVYILGGDAKKLAPIKTDKLLLSIKNPLFQVELNAMPQEKDPAGTASRFVGKDEKFGKEQEFEGTVSGEVDGKPYAGDFKEEPEKPAKK